MATLKPSDFIITRKRKKYRFALFANSPLCFEASEFLNRKTDVLELGAGTGLFSVKLAVENPNKIYLACDVKADRLQKGARIAEEKKLKNIYFLRAHANQLEQVLSPSSLKEIWLTFPDPYLKKRQAKHRLTNSSFLNTYQKLLQKTGQLYFKTDNHVLFGWSLEQLVDNGWKLDELSYDLHNSNLKKRYKTTTTYEEKFIGQGLAICFLRARPPSVAAANHQPSQHP